MEAQAARRGKGARKASAAQAARRDGATEPAPTPKGPGKRQQSYGAAEAGASLAKGAAQAGKADTCRGGRQTTLEKSAPESQAGDPAGESPVGGDKEALPSLKQECRRKAKARRPEKAAVASGAASVPKEEEPDGKGRGAAPRREKAPAKERAAKTEEPKPRKAAFEKSAPKPEVGAPAGKSPVGGDKAALQPTKQECRRKARRPEKAAVASGAASVPKEEEPDGEGRGAAPRREKAPAKERAAKAEEPEPRKAAEPPARGAAAPRSQLARVLDRLVLPKREIEEAARRVNALRDHLLRAIKRKPCFSSVETLGTGSYYEHLKINKPDEFDIMLKVPGVRVQMESYECDYKGAYCFVKLKRNPTLQLNEFVDNQQHLSASSILLTLRTIITDEIKTINGMNVTVERKKPGSPAVTLRIGEPHSHILVDITLALEIHDYSKKYTRDVSPWLGKNANRELYKEKLYLVPKNAKDGKHFEDTWRLSFSHIEKAIIMDHGNTKTCCQVNGEKCCRKNCLKLLKYLLEQLKTKHKNRRQFDKLCSYHAKTAFLHTCLMYPSDDKWLKTNLDDCFERLLNYFLDCLRKAELEHFLIPGCNLFCDLKCKILADVIEDERANGFPIFKEP